MSATTPSAHQVVACFRDHCGGAHDYKGIMAVLLTEPSGDQPVITTFNVGEKKGAAQVGFAPVMPGKANPALAKYNAHISKLNLAKRFPIEQAPLKRCAGSPLR